MNGRNQPCKCGSGIKQKKCHPQGVPFGPEPKPTEKKTGGCRMAKLTAMAIVLGGLGHR